MNELDFSGKPVLVVGGSSGIGNGIAQAFRAKGARVAVCGTRAKAADYSPDEGSDLEGLDYSQLDVSDPQAIEAFEAAVRQARRAGAGAGRGDLPARRVRDGRLSQGAGSQSDEPDGVRDQVSCDAESQQGLADHRQFDRGLSLHHGQSGLQRLEGRRGGSDAHTRRGVGRGRHSGQRHRAGPRRHQDDQGDDGESEKARRRDRNGFR